MNPIRRMPRTATVDAPPASPDPVVQASGPAAGGPVGDLYAKLNTGLSRVEYEAWLLPPEQPGSFERIVQGLSMAGGAAALAGVVGLLIWLV